MVTHSGFLPGKSHGQESLTGYSRGVTASQTRLSDQHVHGAPMEVCSMCEFSYYYSFREGMATHCTILAWRIPWAEEPGGPESTGH